MRLIDVYHPILGWEVTKKRENKGRDPTPSVSDTPPGTTTKTFVPVQNEQKAGGGIMVRTKAFVPPPTCHKCREKGGEA